MMQAAPQRVFGLEIQDARLARLTRRVLCIAVLSATLSILSSIASFASDHNGKNFIFGVFLSLLVPACGYFGAKRSDESLTCAFCGCSFLNACCRLFLVVGVWTTMKGFKLLLDDCAQGSTAGDCPTEQFQQFCSKHQPPLDFHGPDSECYRWVHDAEPKLEALLITASILSLPATVLYCFGFCWGNRLYREIRAGHVVVQPPSALAYPMVQAAVQPGASVPMQPGASISMQQPGVQPTAQQAMHNATQG